MRELSSKYSVYILTDPTGASTCYVGCSMHPARRFIEHNARGGNRRVYYWFRALRLRGMTPKLTILETCDSASEAREAEDDIIKWFQFSRGIDCLNRMKTSTYLPFKRKGRLASSTFYSKSQKAVENHQTVAEMHHNELVTMEVAGEN